MAGETLDETIISILSKCKADALHLGIAKINDKTAEILCQHKGSLCLPNLYEISDSAANILSTKEGSLDLPGLKKISEKTANNLFSSNLERVGLDGLDEGYEFIIKKLPNYKGIVGFCGLNFRDGVVVKSLSKEVIGVRGHASEHAELVRIKNIPQSIENYLCSKIADSKERLELHFPILEELSDTAAEILFSPSSELAFLIFGSDHLSMSENAAKMMADWDARGVDLGFSDNAMLDDKIIKILDDTLEGLQSLGMIGESLKKELRINRQS